MKDFKNQLIFLTIQHVILVLYMNIKFIWFENDLLNVWNKKERECDIITTLV